MVDVRSGWWVCTTNCSVNMILMLPLIWLSNQLADTAQQCSNDTECQRSYNMPILLDNCEFNLVGVSVVLYKN